MSNKQLIPLEVQQYQLAYDKLNINKVFEIIGFEPHVGQQLFVDEVQRRDIWFTTITAGRRLGKTYGVAAVACSRLLLPNASIALLAPTFSNAKNLFIETYKYIKKTGIKITEQNKTNLSFTLENGSTFTSISAKNLDSILGAKLSTIIVDEAAILDQEFLEEAIDRHLTPSLASYGVNELDISYGEVILISSPRQARGYFYDCYKKGKSNRLGYAQVRLPTEINPYIPKSFLAAKKKELPPEIYNTEYGGNFDDASGDNVLYSFNYNKHVAQQDEMPRLTKAAVCIAGLDFGFSDNTAMVYIYVEPFTGVYWVLDEYQRNKMSLGEHAKNFKAVEAKYGVEPTFRFYDPSAVLAMSTLSVDHNYGGTPAMNRIQESCEVTNTLFHQDKIKISDTCQNLIGTIEVLEWKDRESSKDPFKKLPKRFGHGDTFMAFKYAIYTHYKVYVESSFEIYTT